MRRMLLNFNVTAVLALLAAADLVLFRVIDSVFLPQNPTAMGPRVLSFLALYCNHLATLLAIVVLVLVLYQQLRTDSVFPSTMRITVTSIAIFFLALATLGAFSYLTSPRHQTHVRLAHAFLVFFLAVGVLRGQQPLRARIGISLYALPLVAQALSLFFVQTGVAWMEPYALARWGRAGVLLFFAASPLFFLPWPLRRRAWTLGLCTGIAISALLGAAIMKRFDLVQVVAYYGLRLELSGVGNAREVIWVVLSLVAYATLAGTWAVCFLQANHLKLAGWGLVLLATSGVEITSSKLALLSLCGLLALAVTRAEEARPIPS